MEIISDPTREPTLPPGEMINWYDDIFGDQIWHRDAVALLGNVVNLPHIKLKWNWTLQISEFVVEKGNNLLNNKVNGK